MPDAEPSDPLTLEAAVRDLEEGWRRGERPAVEQFLRQNPALATSPEAVLDLIYAELLAREAAGLPGADADYRARFPALAGPLADLLDLHRSLIAPGRMPPAPPPAGGTLSLPPRYRDPEEVGRGGMAVVYRAVDQVLDRTVAVKVLFPTSDAADRAARLGREALALARIAHPGIVQVFDAGEYAGTAFLVMEYVPGGTLRDRLKAGLVPAGEAAELVRKLADAVATAHRERVVHRDIKPSNVLAGTDGTVKLSDFGLAKLLDEDASQSGAVVGTVAYMAPEQAAGRRSVGRPTDVYALGAILYECLAGRPPFLGETALEVLSQVAEAEPVPPSRFRRGVPSDLEAVCLKCLEKEPARRYPTAAKLADDLGRFLAGRPTTARSPSAVNRLGRRVRRNPFLAALAGAILLSLTAGAVGITWQWQRAERANASLRGALDAEVAQRRVSEQLLYNATISQAVVFWEAGEVSKAREELSTAVPRAGREDLRGWEWHYLDRLFRPEVAVLPCENWVTGIAPLGRSEFAVASGLPRLHGLRTPSPTDGRAAYLSWPADGRPAVPFRPGPALTTGATGLAVDPAGKRVAWGTADGRVVLSEAGTQRVIRSWDVGGEVNSLTFARSGTILVAGCQDGGARVIAVDGDGGSAPVRHTVWTDSVCLVHAAPDGDRVVCYGGGTGVRLYSLPHWKPLGEWGQSEGPVRAVTFTPDGALVTGGVNGRVAVWDGGTGTPVAAWDAHAGPIYAVAVRPDGRTLASAGSDRAIRLWDRATGKPRGSFRGHVATVRSLCFGPDPRWLASGGQDATVRIWDTEQDPRGSVLPLDNHLNGVSVAPDDGRVRVRAISQGGVIRSWASTGRGEAPADVRVNIAPQKHFPVSYTAFLGAGRLAAGVPADDPNTVAVWESATGREVFRAPPAPGRVLTVAADHRGRRLAWVNQTADGVELRTWASDEGQAPSPPTFIPAAFARAVATTADGRGAAVIVRPRPGEPNQLWLAGPTGQSFTSVGQGKWTLGGLAYSPDGQFFAASIDGDVRTYRAGTGEVVSSAPEVGPATCIAFSPDGRRMAAVGYDGVVSLIIPESGKVVFQLRGLAPRRPDDVASDARVAFSPDGQALISTNWDGSINVWNAAVRSETHSPPGEK